MAQKVNPKGFRLRFTQPFMSRWFTKNLSVFRDLVLEDTLIRQSLIKHFPKILFIVIERTDRPDKECIAHIRVQNTKTLNLEQTALKIQKSVQIRGSFKIKIQDELSPIESIVDQAQISLKPKNLNLKFALKQIATQARKNRQIKGFRMECSGRTAQSLMAVREIISFGKMPRQTLSIPIDYCAFPVQTRLGILRVKIWIRV